MQLSLGHNVLMIRPPEAGKGLLARGLPGVLPRVIVDETLAVAHTYSVADHRVGEPIRINTIWVTIERGEGNTLEFTDNNVSDFRIEISLGAEA